MTSLLRSRLLRRFLAVAAAVLLVTAFAPASPAAAHGSTVDPASRNYGCWLRWGSDFQNPNMATLDPMCYQAWQYNTLAMWNWNGLYREGVAGNHEAAIPDGQLCSAGHTGDGRYNSMDAIGDWKATNVSTNFSVKLWDQASHGADYIRVYVTKQGFNPLTQPLGWGNLELLTTVPKTPAAQWTPESAGGVSKTIPVTAPGRTGRHIVYTLWQASHADQSYYFCADVNFGGTTTPTSAPATTRAPVTSAAPTTRAPVTSAPATTRAPVTSAAATTRPPVTSSGPTACTAAYTVSSQWSGGFIGDVKVTAGSAGISGWKVTWTFANGQTITSGWSAAFTSSGASITATNVDYNGRLSGGTSTSFGFNGTWTGTNSVPTLTCTATA